MAIIVQDTFTGTDGTALTSHTTDTGQSWVAVQQTFALNGNKAKATGTGTPIARVNTAKSDNLDISVDMIWQTYTGMEFRANGSTFSYYLVRINSSGLGLFRFINSTQTSLASYAFTPVAGTTYTVRVTLQGSVITVYINGTQRIAYTDTDTTLLNYTSCGIRTNADTTSTFDNFIVQDLGGGATGTDVSYSYALKQQIYADRTAQNALRQAIYADSVNAYPTRQTVYADRSNVFATAQNMYNDTVSPYATKQVLYADKAFSYALKQAVYADRNWQYPLQQQIFADYILYSANFPIQVTIYKDVVQAFQTKQQSYADRVLSVLTRQEWYKNVIVQAVTKQIIYADRAQPFVTRQTIWADRAYVFATTQQIYDESLQIIGRVELEGNRELYVYLVGNRELNVNLKGGV